MAEWFPILYLYVLATVVCGAVGLIIWYCIDPTLEHRIAIRWWSHKPNWLWGTRYAPREYRALHLGPLEIVLRSKRRANRLFRKVIDDAGAVPGTDSDTRQAGANAPS